MAQRVLFRGSRLSYGGLTKMQRITSMTTHSYRQFGNQSTQTAAGVCAYANKWLYGAVTAGVLGSAYGIYNYTPVIEYISTQIMLRGMKLLN